MEQFKIKPGGFNEIRKRILVNMIPLNLIIIVVVVVVLRFNPSNHNSNVFDLRYLIPLLLLIVGLRIFRIYRSVNRQKNLFESYTLLISYDSMVRQQLDTPTIKISFSDVNEIIKNSNGSFTIKGRNTLDVIGVPPQIDNYGHLESTLNNIRRLDVLSKKTVSQKLRLPLTIVTLALMASVYLATNKIIVGISGTILCGVFIWSFIQIQRSKNIDAKIKRTSYWTILVLFSIILITIFKLSAK